MIIRRIGVLSLAKFMGGIYGAIGLIFGAIFSLLALAGAAIGSAQADEPGAAVIGAVMGVGAVIVLPILYGVMGFVGGLIASFLYNLFASIFGGIELEVDMQGPAFSPAGHAQPPHQTSAFS
jgi:hypothetical protein